MRDHWIAIGRKGAIFAVAFGALLAGCGAFEQLPSEITIVNEFDFDVVVLRGAVDGDVNDVIEERDADNLSVQLRESGAEFRLRQTFPSRGEDINGDDLFCANEAEVLWVLEVLDTSGWTDNGPPNFRNFSPDDFDLVLTVGPGYCVDSRRSSTYVLGDPYSTVADLVASPE